SRFSPPRLRSDFQYDLRRDLIAQTPLAERSASRLLVLDGATGAIPDRRFADLPQALRDGHRIVWYDARVPRAAGARAGWSVTPPEPCPPDSQASERGAAGASSCCSSACWPLAECSCN